MCERERVRERERKRWLTRKTVKERQNVGQEYIDMVGEINRWTDGCSGRQM